jgi:hypothetical protein
MNKQDIYDQHKAAFANVSAYVVIHEGKRVATVAFKFPKDGAGRLYAYVHWLGVPMVRGFANGYGYDKASAACAVAAKRIQINLRNAPEKDPPEKVAFVTSMAKDSGRYWYQELDHAGFVVLQAV